MRYIGTAWPRYLQSEGRQMQSPTGVIPIELNSAKDLEAVKKFLMSLNIDWHDRKAYLFAWARNVGVKLRQADYDSLLD